MAFDVDGNTIGVVAIAIPVVGSIALFSFLSVAAWSDARRKEREAYYRSETLKKIAESSGEGAKAAIELLREQKKSADQTPSRRHEAGRLDHGRRRHRCHGASAWACARRTGLSRRTDSAPDRLGPVDVYRSSSRPKRRSERSRPMPLCVISLHYNELVGSRTGRSLVARREESPNSAEQCAG